MSRLRNMNTEYIETKTLKEKDREIKKLKSLLKKKDDEVSVAKQKAGFFARKYAEAEEKLNGKTKRK